MSERPVHKVLIVDDDAFIRRPLELFFRDAGFEPITADGGDECLDRVKRDMPDVVIMDVMMPGRDGFAICRELKDDPASSSIPVVLLTGRGGSEDELRGLEAGAVQLITKPYSPRQLVRTVRQLVDAGDARRETA